MKVLKKIEEWRGQGRKVIVPLVDPDRYDSKFIDALVKGGADIPLIFVGGSVVSADTDAVVRDIKTRLTGSDVVLFPGDYSQIARSADAILFLSLLSGRNPEYLIGQQVKSAPVIRRLGMEAISTAYLLIDGGRLTSVQYVSATLPLPADKPDLVVATALAAEMLGFRMIYLEAGSGAANPVNPDIVRAVRASVSVPIIVGGGLRSADAIRSAFSAGADLVVVGTAFEQNPALAGDIL